MRYSCLLIILFSEVCFAGIENELLIEQHDKCTVRITHDATSDSENGTLIFKSFKIENDIHHPCEINETTISISLNNAIKQYSLRTDLKPISSIMIGRLIRYPWAKNYLKNNPISQTNHQEFNKIIFNSPIIEPFKNGLVDHKYKITEVSCEKILLNEKNHVIDAMCWLIIKE